STPVSRSRASSASTASPSTNGSRRRPAVRRLLPGGVMPRRRTLVMAALGPFAVVAGEAELLGAEQRARVPIDVVLGGQGDLRVLDRGADAADGDEQDDQR